MRTVMPFISAFLYNGARNSSSRSSSGGATNATILVVANTSKMFFLPFGITPGSINVANEKLAMTKNVKIPCIAGTYGCLGQ